MKTSKIIKESFISIFLIIISCFFGLRIINEFLKFDDRSKYSYEYSFRTLKSGKKLRVAHHQDYNINSTGENTIVFISDSFGEGRKCGNSNNITGCISRLDPNIKVVNLSLKGTNPAYYLSQITTYFSDQRIKNNNISGETLIISLYSNDIVIDSSSCDYLKSKNSSLKNIFNKKEFLYLNNMCKNFYKIANETNRKNIAPSFSIPFQSQIRFLAGDYSFLFLRELAAQLSLKILKDSPIGRARYIPLWNNFSSPETKLMIQILKDIKSICNKYKCNLRVATFPNVENLSPSSKVRLSMNNFSSFMNKNYKYIIHDGYQPFIERNIKKANYSLTDIHSNCEGYKLYASWLMSL